MQAGVRDWTAHPPVTALASGSALALALALAWDNVQEMPYLAPLEALNH